MKMLLAAAGCFCFIYYLTQDESSNNRHSASKFINVHFTLAHTRMHIIKYESEYANWTKPNRRRGVYIYAMVMMLLCLTILQFTPFTLHFAYHVYHRLKADNLLYWCRYNIYIHFNFHSMDGTLYDCIFFAMFICIIIGIALN